MDMIWTVINSQPKPKIVVLDCFFFFARGHSILKKNDSFAKPSNCRTRPSYFELAHSESVAIFFFGVPLHKARAKS